MVVFLTTSSGCYCCAATYNEIRVKRVGGGLVEESLAIKNKLTIRDRLDKWGYTGDTLCVFCWGCIESKDHLFFVCPLARRIWVSCWISGSLIQVCWTKQRTTRAKAIKRKLLIQNIYKLTWHFARHKPHFPILETTDFVEIENFLFNVCRKKKLKIECLPIQKKIK